LVLVVAVTLLGWLIHSFISPVNVAMLYLLAVVVIAFKRGLRPAIFTSVIGVLAFNFFFVSPYFTFRISNTEYLITFIGMIIVGAVISLLVAQARRNADAAQIREKETATLYALSQDLAVATDTGAILAAVSQHIRGIFQWQSAFFLPEKNGLGIWGQSPGLLLDADDLAVATWAFRHGATAGYETDTLPGSKIRYIPIQSSRGVLGILGVKPAEPDSGINYEQSRTLTAFANQAALALERVNPANETGTVNPKPS
jgi:two-component system sensor histidine kinase KdpD